ncbi:hypothetical protein [Niallia circulans]|uniref:hypothetical protein n=1 Tax=Niallia circulans TaxID=1397 RepID=UPI001F322A46|nr:hypothetical protein [Niallia circulans]MCF2649011.1 hypothetical protein [Niallia circulans]
MKKIQNWIAILAMVFLLVQSTIGVVSYVNREEPSERMGMMGQGQAPTNATASVNTNTDTNTDTDTNADSDTNSNTTEDNGFSMDNQNGMTPFNGMEERGGAPNGDNVSTASLVGYIIGIILSLGGLVVTVLGWRKNKKVTIAE